MRKPVSEQSVRKAIQEYDRIKQNAFLDKYHFGKSRNYFLIVDGKEYDSKAILAAAYGYEYPAERVPTFPKRPTRSPTER
jgi:hypothetical protein